MKKPLILIGGGGHCKACIDVIEAEGKYEIEGIVDTKDKIGTSVLDYKVIGHDGDLKKLIDKGFSFLITVGQIQSAQLRKQLFQNLIARHVALATVVAPSAIVSRYAQLGAGTIVMHQATVNAGAVVGNNVIINTNALVEHDAVVGDHVHVSTQAVLNGAAAIDEGSFLGSNAVVVHGKQIGKDVVIGAGSVVASHILTPGTYAGNPAKQLRK
jgi:sugar O-acyltransferase (sialic acid O-acetyltransferase NeuD family)